ncbi:MAG: hypothetical protein A2Y33_03800 [Spirochaetes bacterium GWF1_51_8]|nr:MAG: hypothetical protein A2Y33_03800 [Spirochaetes bacterium GWF1_51_8]
MTNRDMAKVIAKGWPDAESIPRYQNQIEIVCGNPDSIAGLLHYLQSVGFDHMSNLTCVDWLEENRFDVTYNLWSYKYDLQATVKAGIDRDEPEIPTAMDVWPQAQAYEQEIHEMFGVEFIGNPDLSPLFLHNWKDIPPLRKDFDTEAYSVKAFGAVRNKE